MRNFMRASTDGYVAAVLLGILAGVSAVVMSAILYK